MFKPVSLAGDAIFGDAKNLSRWGLAEESRSLGA
jgi:hypothetical protein